MMRRFTSNHYLEIQIVLAKRFLRYVRFKTQNSSVTLVSLIIFFASSKDENPNTSLITYY